MHCRSCGTSLGSEQKFCPNCGTPVNNVNTLGDGCTVADYSNANNQLNVPTGFNSNFNVNEPSDIGFNRNDEQDLNQFGNNDPYANRNKAIVKENSNDQMAGFGNDIRNSEMQVHMSKHKRKKNFPWIGIAIFLVVIMVGGLIGVPLFNSLNIKTYESDDYKLEYNGNWKLDESQDKMTLYYSDNDSRFLLNAVTTFDSINFTIETAEKKADLYDAFYDAWSDLDGGELTGGTETFLTLNDDSLYARIDYKMTGRENIGAFYVVVSPEKNKVISFMSYCTEDNWNNIDKDILKMLDSIIYKSEADSSVYNKFEAGSVKDYTAIGYMNYTVPESWTLDEARTEANSYKSYIFKFRDGVSLLDIKAVTPYDSVTGKAGTTYEVMKNTIIKNYGEKILEKTKTINGKTWYIVITPDYTSNGKSYHNELYFTFSATNKHLYYFEAYVSNDTSENKTKYFNESIDYILESVKLYKVDE